jgi:hypothetical protein
MLTYKFGRKIIGYKDSRLSGKDNYASKDRTFFYRLLRQSLRSCPVLHGKSKGADLLRLALFVCNL